LAVDGALVYEAIAVVVLSVTVLWLDLTTGSTSILDPFVSLSVAVVISVIAGLAGLRSTQTADIRHSLINGVITVVV